MSLKRAIKTKPPARVKVKPPVVLLHGYTAAQLDLLLGYLPKTELPDFVTDIDTLIGHVLATSDALHTAELAALSRLHTLKHGMQQVLAN